MDNYEHDDFSRNRTANEIEINEGKTILETKPQAMIVMLSNRCNIDCIMCGVKNQKWDLPKKTIEEIVKYLPYLEYIQWQGGEVFLLDYFKDLFQEAARNPNLRQIINTNGLLISKEWARVIANAQADITFSIDGVTKGVYEAIRKGAGFEDLLQCIRRINEVKRNDSKIKTSMNVVVMNSNYKQLGQFVDFAHEHQFDSLTLFRIDDNFDGEQNIFHHDNKFAESYIKAVLPEMWKKAHGYGIRLTSYLYPDNNSNMQQDPVRDTNRGMLCYLPWREFTVDVMGTRPDCRCPISAGNIFESSLPDIWNGSVMQEYRKRILRNECVGFCRSECIQGVIPEKALKGEL